MKTLQSTLIEHVEKSGFQAKTVSLSHLLEVQGSVALLIQQGLIDKRLRQNWHFYLETNKNLLEAKTIIIAAMPQPITRLRFRWQGKTHPAEVAPNFIVEKDEAFIEEQLKHVLVGYKVVKAHLALKTLAVRSGLAAYGKNNLVYVPGMGSFLRLIAFYTDFPDAEDNWQEQTTNTACQNCSHCLDHCPTKAIAPDRFLIKAEKCLGFLSQMDPNFPYWVKYQTDRPNAFIGCLACQSVCPINKPYLEKIVDGPTFSAEETGLIMDNTLWEKLPPETQKKLSISPGIYKSVSANLKTLIENNSY